MESNAGNLCFPADIVSIIVRLMPTVSKGRFLLASRTFFAVYEDDFDFWSSIFVGCGLSLTKRDSNLREGERDASLLRKDISLAFGSLQNLTVQSALSMKFDIIVGVPGWFERDVSSPMESDYSIRSFALNETLFFADIVLCSRVGDPEAELQGFDTPHEALAIDVLKFGSVEPHQLPFFKPVVERATSEPLTPVGAGLLSRRFADSFAPLLRLASDGSGIVEEVQLPEGALSPIEDRCGDSEFETITGEEHSLALNLRDQIVPRVVVHDGMIAHEIQNFSQSAAAAVVFRFAVERASLTFLHCFCFRTL